jgi:hypothetical protein
LGVGCGSRSEWGGDWARGVLYDTYRSFVLEGFGILLDERGMS